jgi:hypothetical protein
VFLLGNQGIDNEVKLICRNLSNDIKSQTAYTWALENSFKSSIESILLYNV